MEALRELAKAISQREPDTVIEKIRSRIWVVKQNGYIRGYLTAAKGSMAAKHKNSYARRFSENAPIYPCGRAKLIEQIQSRLTDAEKAQPDIVNRIIKQGLTNGFFKHDRPRKLYWSAGAAEDIVQQQLNAYRLNTRGTGTATSKTIDRLTEKQRAHWQRFAEVP